MYRILAVTTLILASGCATAPPTRYYTLDMRPTGNVGDGVDLELRRITVGEALSGREMLIQTSPTEVEYYAAAQWIAGLDELVADKLAVEFAGGKGAQILLHLRATIKNFEQVEAPGSVEAYVRIAVDAEVESATGEQRTLEKTYTVREPLAADSGLRGLAEGLSRCVEQIAVELASDAAAK